MRTAQFDNFSIENIRHLEKIVKHFANKVGKGSHFSSTWIVVNDDICYNMLGVYPLQVQVCVDIKILFQIEKKQSFWYNLGFDEYDIF